MKILICVVAILAGCNDPIVNGNPSSMVDGATAIDGSSGETDNSADYVINCNPHTATTRSPDGSSSSSTYYIAKPTSQLSLSAPPPRVVICGFESAAPILPITCAPGDICTGDTLYRGDMDCIGGIINFDINGDVQVYCGWESENINAQGVKTVGGTFRKKAYFWL